MLCGFFLRKKPRDSIGSALRHLENRSRLMILAPDHGPSRTRAPDLQSKPVVALVPSDTTMLTENVVTHEKHLRLPLRYSNKHVPGKPVVPADRCLEDGIRAKVVFLGIDRLFPPI